MFAVNLKQIKSLIVFKNLILFLINFSSESLLLLKMNTDL